MSSIKQKGALTKKAITALKSDKKRLVPILMIRTGKSVTTINRWIDKNNDYLTQKKCLDAICKELNMTQEEVLA